MVNFLDIAIFLHELYVEIKGDEKDRLEKASSYFEEISNCLMDIAGELSTNNLSSENLTAKLAYLITLRDGFPEVVGEGIGTSKANNFDILLKNAVGNNTTKEDFIRLKNDSNSYKTVLDNIYYLAGQFKGFAFTINFETVNPGIIESNTTGNNISYLIVFSIVFVVGLFVGLFVDFSKIAAPKIDGKLINPIPYRWQDDETNIGRAYQGGGRSLLSIYKATK